jgi:hypothetical protein
VARIDIADVFLGNIINLGKRCKEEDEAMKRRW